MNANKIEHLKAKIKKKSSTILYLITISFKLVQIIGEKFPFLTEFTFITDMISSGISPAFEIRFEI